MPGTSRDNSNFLKVTRNLVEATASCSSVDRDFSFLSTLAGNNSNPICTPSMQEVGSLHSWKRLLLFRETTTTLSKHWITAMQPLQRHCQAFLTSHSKSFVLRPPLQAASTAPYSFLPSSLPPLLLPLGLKNGYHVFKKSKLDQVCKQSFLLHSF